MRGLRVVACQCVVGIIWAAGDVIPAPATTTKPYFVLNQASLISWTPEAGKLINITVVNEEGNIISIVEDSETRDCQKRNACPLNQPSRISWTPDTLGQNMHFDWTYFESQAVGVVLDVTAAADVEGDDSVHSQSQPFDVYDSEAIAQSNLGTNSAPVTNFEMVAASTSTSSTSSGTSTVLTETNTALASSPTPTSSPAFTSEVPSGSSIPTVSSPSSTQIPPSSTSSSQTSTTIPAATLLPGSKSSSDHLSKGAIAGIVISVFALLAACTLIALFFLRKRRRGPRSSPSAEYISRNKDEHAMAFQPMHAARDGDSGGGGYGISERERGLDSGRGGEVSGAANYRDDERDGDGRRAEYLKQPRNVISAMGQESPEELARLQAEEELLDREIEAAERMRAVGRR